VLLTETTEVLVRLTKSLNAIIWYVNDVCIKRARNNKLYIYSLKTTSKVEEVFKNHI
jgi:hypothetical protein